MTSTTATTDRLLSQVLREVQSLRRDVALVIPRESIAEYKHPKRILASYRKAAKLYPPRDA